MKETTKKSHTKPRIIIPKKEAKYVQQRLEPPKKKEEGNGGQQTLTQPNIIIPNIVESNYWEGLESYGKSGYQRTYQFQMFSEYHQAVTYSGGEAFTMTPFELQQEVHLNGTENIHGILVPGGADIEPEHYNCKRHHLCGGGDGDRDLAELEFTNFALENDIPILGVCRGHQMMNVAAGGTLHQDLSLAKAKTLTHRATNHLVLAEARGMFADIVQARGFPVNSYHHQCLKKIADGFKVCAMAPDGIIEAFYAPHLTFALGVQFHPEYLENKYAEKIFRAFIRAAEDRICESNLGVTV